VDHGFQGLDFSHEAHEQQWVRGEDRHDLVEVRAAHPTKLELTLQSGSPVPITLTAPSDARLVHLRIVGAKDRVVVDATPLLPPAERTFEMKPVLSPGTYRAEALADTGASARFDITVEAGKAPAPLAIELR